MQSEDEVPGPVRTGSPKRVWGYAVLGSSPIGVASIALATVALITIGVFESSLFSTVTCGFLLGIIGVFALQVESARSTLSGTLVRQFLTAYSFRIVATFLFHIWLAGWSPLPLWNIGEHGGDEIGFFVVAEHWGEAWHNGRILTEARAPLETDYSAWTFLIGVIRFIGFRLGGDTLFNAKLLACFFSALLVPYIFLLTRRFFGDATARRSAMLAFWLPDYWYLGASLMRDVMISCLVVIVLYQVLAAARGKATIPRLIVALILNFYVINNLKIWLAGVLTVLCALWWLKEQIERRFWTPLLVGWAVCFVALPLMSQFVASVSKFELGGIIVLGEDISLDERIDLQGNTGIQEASADSLGKEIVSRGAAVRAPILAVQMLVSIPPWASLRGGLSPRGIVETVSAFVWLCLVVFLPAGVLSCIRDEKRRPTVWIWGTALSLVWLLAITSNIILRWRLMVMPLLLILVAQGIQDRRYRWAVQWSAISVCGLLLAYSFVKYVI